MCLASLLVVLLLRNLASGDGASGELPQASLEMASLLGLTVCCPHSTLFGVCRTRTVLGPNPILVCSSCRYFLFCSFSRQLVHLLPGQFSSEFNNHPYLQDFYFFFLLGGLFCFTGALSCVSGLLPLSSAGAWWTCRTPEELVWKVLRDFQRGNKEPLVLRQQAVL